MSCSFSRHLMAVSLLSISPCPPLPILQIHHPIPPPLLTGAPLFVPALRNLSRLWLIPDVPEGGIVAFAISQDNGSQVEYIGVGRVVAKGGVRGAVERRIQKLRNDEDTDEGKFCDILCIRDDQWVVSLCRLTRFQFMGYGLKTSLTHLHSTYPVQGSCSTSTTRRSTICTGFTIGWNGKSFGERYDTDQDAKSTGKRCIHLVATCPLTNPLSGVILPFLSHPGIPVVLGVHSPEQTRVYTERSEGRSGDCKV